MFLYLLSLFSSFSLLYLLCQDFITEASQRFSHAEAAAEDLGSWKGWRNDGLSAQLQSPDSLIHASRSRLGQGMGCTRPGDAAGDAGQSETRHEMTFLF